MKKINTDDVLVFDADRLNAGIVYHLSQRHQPFWKSVEAITPDSLLNLQRRLRRERPEMVVSKFLWRRMTDVERLKELMNATKTTAVYLPKSHVVELVSFEDVKRKHRPNISTDAGTGAAEKEGTGEDGQG